MRVRSPAASRARLLLCTVAILAAVPAAAQKAPPACPFAPDALKGAFGVGFAAGTPETGMGTGCVYRTVGGSKANGTDFSLGVYVNASMPEPTRRMMLAAGTRHELVPVPGDADRAVAVRHRGDVPAFPQVAYVRGGHDVMLQIVGLGFEPDEKARLARIDRMNQALLKLPRLP